MAHIFMLDNPKICTRCNASVFPHDGYVYSKFLEGFMYVTSLYKYRCDCEHEFIRYEKYKVEGLPKIIKDD